MKKIFVFISCLLLLSCSQHFQDDTNTPVSGVLVWDYPVKPGTEEWKNFHSNEEMVEACQIPEDILSSLSTKDLTEICLRYPLLNDVFAFNSLSKGADKLFNDFNGIRELFKRKEAPEELLRHYNYVIQNLSFLDEPATDLEKGRFIISVSTLEFLLGFHSYKAVVTKEDNKKVLQCLVAGYERKCKYPDYFRSLGPSETNFYSRAHVIIKMSPESLEEIPGKEQNGVFRGWPDKEIMDIINELSYRLIK
ncbi:MAG: hypothetical protein FWF53_05215 [Candidatus Azobacteroides sp.]|nr:hypothetical protein [Candidatus Azobacteroides sp.]